MANTGVLLAERTPQTIDRRPDCAWNLPSASDWTHRGLLSWYCSWCSRRGQLFTELSTYWIWWDCD